MVIMLVSPFDIDTISNLKSNVNQQMYKWRTAEVSIPSRAMRPNRFPGGASTPTGLLSIEYLFTYEVRIGCQNNLAIYQSCNIFICGLLYSFNFFFSKRFYKSIKSQASCATNHLIFCFLTHIVVTK